ncbi:hypothetical protein T06_2770 [Trichinella sp. T6]|nr:hypothetical protein T06_2770 [Trichinella sp. T6]
MPASQIYLVTVNIRRHVKRFGNDSRNLQALIAKGKHWKYLPFYTVLVALHTGDIVNDCERINSKLIKL